MDRVRLEYEFFGPRRREELRRRADAQRLAAAAVAAPTGTAASWLVGLLSPARAGGHDRPGRGKAARVAAAPAPARHAGG